MDMVNLYMKMVVIIQANLKTDYEMEKEQNTIKMVIQNMKEIFQMINITIIKENFIMKMVKYFQVNLKMDKKMDMVVLLKIILS